ncbi:VanZ family protein [Halococcoides cellulosivorans]|uniref:Antibiotic resistance protein VanZ n=1 Tax=Halococcoides cellulosivorans TaxID=1679096 RepID=A0A2R4WY57_9EURY|nr:antibiotic resistance protein VanZ [Halococcoides cellulosivorans]AWB26475.1 antibiotic resistance protein VanZ [Halococcoides cellulosivorans]
MTLDRSWGLVAVIGTAILAASLIDPGIAGPAGEGPLGGLAVTTWLHVLGYTALTAALLGAVGDRRFGIVVAPVVAIAVGAGIELLQWPLAWRTASVADATVNAIAAITMTAVWPACRRVRGAVGDGKDADATGDAAGKTGDD